MNFWFRSIKKNEKLPFDVRFFIFWVILNKKITGFPLRLNVLNWFSRSYFFLYNNRRRINLYMKTTVDFKFDFCQAVKQNGHT